MLISEVLPNVKMSIIDTKVLQSIGARPTGLRSPIPLYMKVRMENIRAQGGIVVRHSVQTDLSYQQMAALILEIPDFSKLRRYLFMK